MAPKLAHLLIAFVIFFSIQSFVGQARTLKSERQQSISSFLQKLEGVQKGQTVEGLIELKQYLKKFGYFPNDDNNIMTSDFDDHLESALKTYQKYFHLNITGNLDSATVKQMMIPRCGMPDIIPNNTKSKHKFHMVAHYAYGTEKWPPSNYNLAYTFGSGGVQVVDLDTLRTVCSNAFKKWSDVSKFSFQEATDGASANIVIEFYSRDHGDNFPFDGRGNKLAHAFYPQNGRLHYDADESWSTDPTMEQADLESVSVHEIGHLLGLRHSTDPEAIMFPSIEFGARKRDLAQDDIDGINALYAN